LTDSSQGVIKPGQFSVETLGQISVEIDSLPTAIQWPLAQSAWVLYRVAND